MKYLLTDWLCNWEGNWLTNQLLGWLSDRVVDQLEDWLSDWLFDGLTLWSNDQMINWLFSLLTPWPTDWPTNRLTEWLSRAIHTPELYYFNFFHPGISSKLEERPSAITDMQTKSVMPDSCRKLCLHTHCHKPIKKASWCWGMEWNLSICKPESSISILQSIPCSYFKKL